MYNKMDMTVRTMVMSSVSEKTTCAHHHINVVMIATMGIKGYRK